MKETHPFSPNDEILVTLLYGANRIDVTNITDNPDEPVHSVYVTEGRMRTVEKGFEAYQEMGPGLHTPLDSPRMAKQKVAIHSVAKLLPRQVVSAGNMYEVGTEDPNSYVYFGNIAIQGRRATDEEIVRGREEAKEQKKRQELALREACIAKDVQKISYIGYDHAFITVGQDKYFLNLETQPSILACRVLKYLQEVGIHQRIDRVKLAETIWDEMPTTERKMLGVSDSDVYRADATGIIETISTAIKDLARPLGIIDRHKLIRTTEPLDLAFCPMPDSENYYGVATPIAAPGTSKRYLESLQDTQDSASPDRLKADTACLTALAFHTRRWSAEEAITVLDLIMTKPGKLALLNIYPDHSKQEQVQKAEELLEVLHKRLNLTLGESYIGAKSSRIIAGTHMASGSSKKTRARQSGGAVDLSAVNEEKLRHWSIGKPYSLKNITE